MPTVKLGNSNELKIGESVVAIGNPQGLENTVSNGIISGKREFQGFTLLQTTVPISPGSSGGPLFNMRGEVIGITSATLAIENSQNLNFAIPINYARGLLQENRNLSFNALINETPDNESKPISELDKIKKQIPKDVIFFNVYGIKDITYRNYVIGLVAEYLSEYHIGNYISADIENRYCMLMAEKFKPDWNSISSVRSLMFQTAKEVNGFFLSITVESNYNYQIIVTYELFNPENYTPLCKDTIKNYYGFSFKGYSINTMLKDSIGKSMKSLYSQTRTIQPELIK